MSIQLVKRNVEGVGTGIAMSPERDLALMFPAWIRKAYAVETEIMGRGNGDLDRVYRQLLDFCDKCLNDPKNGVDTRRVDEVLDLVGLPGLSGATDAEGRLALALLRVLMGSYYSGRRMSVSTGCDPIHILDVASSVWSHPVAGARGGVRSFFRRLFRRAV